MLLQFKLFILSARNAPEDEEKLNVFLRKNRVLNVHREFVQNEQNPHWSMLVEYLESVSNPSGNAGTALRHIFSTEMARYSSKGMVVYTLSIH